MRFHFDRVDWDALRQNRKLKLNIGLAVVLFIFFAFFLDIIMSVWGFRYYIEKQPEKVKVIMKKPPAKEAKPSAPVRKEARVAIILDDAGGTVPNYDSIRSIKEPLTISVLPKLATSGKVAKDLMDAGFEVILHLPMESFDGKFTRYDSGMVITSSSDSEIKRTVKDDFSSFKGAVGFNNHMGSKATSDERVMDDVFSEVKGMNVYFVDSRTSGRSVAYREAKKNGIRAAASNIFLDGTETTSEIEARLRRLINMARSKGSAIGIGHATRPLTISILKRLMPKYAQDGIRFVRASELVK